MPKPSKGKDRIPEVTVEPEVFADMDNFDLVNNPTVFAKALRFQFPKFSKGFTSSDFEEFVQEHVGVENLKSLGRLNFPNEWQMEVESKEVREKLIRWGKTKIKNRSCWISPLCTSELRGFVHWLPNTVPNQAIKDLLSEYGEVLFIENQKQILWDGKVNSDSRYYALYLRAGKSKEDLPHFTEIGEFNVLVTVRGRNPACFHCRESGHRKQECKKYKEKLHGYCKRAAKPGVKRSKPRGKRFKADDKESKDTTKAPENQKTKDTTKAPENQKTKDTAKAPEKQTTKNVVGTPGTKQKATVAKVTTQKEKKTPAVSEVSPLDEIGQLKLKVAELLSETFSKLEKQVKLQVPPESAAPAATGEVEKKKRKKKKSKKKNEEKQEVEAAL